MIQDIEPHRLDNSFAHAGEARDTDAVICFRDGDILVVSGDTLTFPSVCTLGAVDLTYLFSVDERRFFLKKDAPEPTQGQQYIPFKSIREHFTEPAENIFALYTAKHIADWYRDNRFCGRCGGVMRHSDRERAMTCPVCGYTSYPRIMPAVIVGVTRGNEIMLTRYRRGFGHNALVAGFAEIGETLEQTVEREVMEEIGIKVKNIRYYKSQPWGGANDILVGFYCDADGDSTVHMDEGELRSAVWTKREDIELQPDNYSLTNEMMRLFKEGREI